MGIPVGSNDHHVVIRTDRYSTMLDVYRAPARFPDYRPAGGIRVTCKMIMAINHAKAVRGNDEIQAQKRLTDIRQPSSASLG
jgi:hypothetical protein